MSLFLALISNKSSSAAPEATEESATQKQTLTEEVTKFITDTYEAVTEYLPVIEEPEPTPLQKSGYPFHPSSRHQ